MTPSKTGSILGVGLAVQDVIVRWRDSSLPVREARATDMRLQGGGMTATALVAAGRLGAKTALRSVVGDGPLGRMILDELAGEGVDVSGVLRDAGRIGPMVLVCVDGATGERRFPCAQGLHDDDVPVGDAPSMDAVGCVLVDGSRAAMSVPAAEAARAAGVPVVGDVEGLGEGMRKLLPSIDYAIVSHECARRIAAAPRAACEKIREMGPSVAIVTLGEAGSACLTDDGFIETPSFPVEVVDTTGAGDAYHGAFCFGLVSGLPLKTNLQLSCAVGAMNCRRLGGRSGLPTLAEVRAFLADYDRQLPDLRGASA